MTDFPNRLFIAGTDTDVGKTLISAALVWGLKAHYFKPFQSGSAHQTDTDFIRQLTELDPDHFSPETYCFEAPLSPNQAATLEGQRINPSLVKLPQYRQNQLIVEGVGGLMVPLNESELLLDWLANQQLPVLVVARTGLGTLNHTLLSVEALKHRGIPLWGIALNGPANRENRLDIQNFTHPPRLFQVPQIERINQRGLMAIFNCFNDR